MTARQVCRSARQRGLGLLAKRLLDLSVATVLLVVLAPLLVVVAIAIRLDSPGPALYRQHRHGRGGGTFEVIKFRSMHRDADVQIHEQFVRRLLQHDDGAHRGRPGAVVGPPAYKLRDDPRITRVGAVLRRTSIDELPQLLNVVRGQMSLVGPRPDIPASVEAYEDWQWRRFEVLPGMTGLWQVSGRGELSPHQMLQLDIEYVDRWSLGLDLRLLGATIPAVLRRDGSA